MENMTHKIVKESLTEDVASKFLANKYAFPDEFDEFEKKYARSMMKRDEDIVWNDPDRPGWKIIKNPSSIEILGKNTRGIITQTGDLYMENFSKGTIHNIILEILYKIGELKGTFTRGWGNKLPQESGFLTVQRYKDTDYICIGESNRIIYYEEDWLRLLPKYEEFLQKARQKNPNLLFSNMLVGIKYPWIEGKPSHIKEGAKPQNLIKNFINL